MIAAMSGAHELVCGRDVAAAALDQNLDRIVVIDHEGTIVLTNAAWRAAAIGFDHAELLGCGVNYLDVCERCDAAVVAAGIRAVLDGERPRFEFDYPCHSPTEDAWFALEVTPLSGPTGGAVLTHSTITARVGSDRVRSADRVLDAATMLATTPAGVPGLARRLADAQSEGSSLAVVLITLCDLVEIESRHGRRARDELVVHAVARVLRLTGADDVVIRPSTNLLMLFAGTANSHAAEFLCGRIADVLDAPYLVGAAQMCAHAVVEVAVSDQFSTLDSLLREVSGDAGPVADATVSTAARGEGRAASTRPSDASFAPLVVYSLPDGLLQSANSAAAALLGLEQVEPGRLYARDIADPADQRRTETALRALSSGVTDSYRAHRTLLAGDAPLAVLTAARRLLIASGALAVVMSVPIDADDVPPNGADDPFAAALVAGTIDGRGAVSSVSAAISPMEVELIGALGGSLRQAAHPADGSIVDEMLETLGRTGSAAGEVRLPHSELGWVRCQFQLFAMQRPAGEPGPDSSVVEFQRFAFVLSASIGTGPMLEKIARLERHIRRIGSEVHAADVAMTVSERPDRAGSSLLSSLDLTERQREIVERLLRGQRVVTIGAALYISQSTVRNHLARVYRLVGVHSQEALLETLRAG